MKKVKLNENQQKLLLAVTSGLIPEIENPEYESVTELAFEHWLPKSKEIVQVQVFVTRDESDFLEPFQTETMQRWSAEEISEEIKRRSNG